MTPAPFGTSSTPSRSASPWPRIEASGVFSSWLTESRNDALGVLRAVELLGHLVERGRERRHLVGPSTGSGPGVSPAASCRLAIATRRIGRATAPASRNAAIAARPAPAAAAITKAIVNGRQSEASSFAERSSTIACWPTGRAA